VKITTRGTTRTPAALPHTLRAEVTLNPDAFDFDVPDTAQIRERTFGTIREAVETARRLHEARPFGQHLRTTITGPLGTIRVSPNGRLWGDETLNVEYELRGESLAVHRAGRGAVPPAAGGTR